MRNQTDSNKPSLGSRSFYQDQYSPDILEAIDRKKIRADINIFSSKQLPFHGYDLWNAYEFSWLDMSGCPDQSLLQINTPCSSPNIVESKSLKLYLNSFSQARFKNKKMVQGIIKTDLENILQTELKVNLIPVTAWQSNSFSSTDIILDNHRIEVDNYNINADLLCINSTKEKVEESLCSNLFRCLCPVTGQPDTASVRIKYKGYPIKSTALFAYLISYRQSKGFHEQVVERIFLDIMNIFAPEYLYIEAAFQRRGGIDITPVRTNIAENI